MEHKPRDDITTSYKPGHPIQLRRRVWWLFSPLWLVQRRERPKSSVPCLCVFNGIDLVWSETVVTPSHQLCLFRLWKIGTNWNKSFFFLSVGNNEIIPPRRASPLQEKCILLCISLSVAEVNNIPVHFQSWSLAESHWLPVPVLSVAVTGGSWWRWLPASLARWRAVTLQK